MLGVVFKIKWLSLFVMRSPGCAGENDTQAGFSPACQVMQKFAASCSVVCCTMTEQPATLYQ